MLPLNKLSGANGTLVRASTDAYSGRFFAVEFNEDAEVTALEIAGVDVLANCIQTTGGAVLAGTVLVAPQGAEFTKITTDAATQITIWRA